MATTARWLVPGSNLMIAPHSFDGVFEQFFGYGTRSNENGMHTHTLPVDIVETEDAYLLYATMAGVPKEGVEVTFENGTLSLVGSAAPFAVEGKLIRQERPWGNWSRKLELPKEIDSANIGAEFENGVLAVRVPKAAKVEPLRIAIGAAVESVEA
jgi:HSP20 family protein